MPTSDPLHLWHAWRVQADAAAFAALVTPEMRYAADLARRAGASADEAEDVVQDALVKLADEKTDLPVEVGIRAWLCRRALLGVKMLVRSNVRRRERERRAMLRRAPSESRRAFEHREQIERALGALADADRQAIVLRYLHDLEYAEMAHVLDVTENACRIRVHRALGRLRTGLGNRAAAMVAMVVVPPLAQEGALIGAATSATTATAAGLGAKGLAAAGAGVVAAAAVTLGVLAGKPQAPAPSPQEPPPAVAAAPVPAPRPPALALLEDHFAERTDADARIASFDAVERLIGAPGPRSVRVASHGDITPLPLWRLRQTHDRIELEAGVYRTERGPPIRGRLGVVELVGAGREKTVLQGYDNTPFQVNEGAEVAGIVIRDLTYDGHFPPERKGTVLLGVQGKTAALFERVHFRRWSTAGYSAPVGNSGMALLAFRDCRFTGGFCREDLDQSALGVRGRTLYHFENCRFSDLRHTIVHGTRDPRVPHPRNRGRFVGCTFDSAPLVSRPPRGAPTTKPYPLRVRGGRALIGPFRSDEPTGAAWWHRDGASAIEDVSYGKAPVHLTAVPLRRVLEAYEAPKGMRIVGVRGLSWYGCERPLYALYLQPVRGRLETKVVRLEPGGTLAPVAPHGIHLHDWLPTRAGEGKELLDLVRDEWSRIDKTGSIGIFMLHQYTGGKANLSIEDRRGNRVRLQRR